MALSLAVVLALGGVVSPGAASTVQAEESQTGQDGGVSSGDAAVQAVSAIDGIALFSASNVQTVNKALDFATLANGGTTVAAGTYGDEVVSITFINDVDYSTGTKTYGGIEYTSSIKAKENGTVVVNADGTVTAGGAFCITSAKAATISVVMDKCGSVIHMQCLENGTLVNEQVGTAIASSGTTGCSFNIEADKKYYFWADAAKVKLWNFAYSYEMEDSVETVTVTDSVDLSSTLETGKTYGNESVVKVSVLENMTAKSASIAASDVTAIREGDNVPSDFATGNYVVGSNSPSPGNGAVPTTGAVVKLEAVTDCAVTFVIKAGGKSFYCVQDVTDGTDVDIAGVADATKAMASGYYSVKCDLQAGNTYYAYASGSKASIYGILYSYETEKGPELPEIDFPDGVPAFPGAEGGGKYATGGRGGDVYVVTNLNDSGEGSLRYGIETAPASGRIIVFDVGGTIHLESTLTFKNKSNITVAGQTAPGDGITIAGYDTNISDCQNIVIRFVRFRVGTENLLKGGDSMDALWGRDNDTFMIDHCTFSWNTDETLSTYRGKNGTVQWCIISESLTVSGHSKGRHGYGGIWGGDSTVFQNNLMTNHTSRNPRIGGGSMTDPTSVRSYATVQLSNNVLYNHGYFPCYGGGFAYTNYINNYVKPGPGTRESLSDTLINVGENGKDGGFYVAGNILEGNAAITADNSLGIKESAAGYISNAPYTPSEENPDAFSNITLRSAEDCYDLVLANAGATYPHRDAVDARVVAQVKTNTGSYINTQDEVGGYPAATVTAADEGRTDTDGDGIPDEWESNHGLNSNDASDSRTMASGNQSDPNYGYAWIEVYFNELVEDVVTVSYEAPNPDVTIDLADNTLVNEGTDVTVNAVASANNGGSIAKVEFYNGAELVGTADNAPYSYTYAGLSDGTYNISVRAYDNDGNATQSNTSRLHVNSTAGTGEWTSADVGQPGVRGTASLVDGVLTVKGAGKLGKSEGSVAGSDLNNAATDDFQFVYQKLTGDAEIVAKLDSYTAVDNHTFNGLMFRESLDEDAAAVAIGLTMTKIWDGYDTIWTAFMVNRAAKGGAMTDISETIDGAAAAENAGIPIISNLGFKSGNTFNGTWLKITRIGDEFIGAVSNDGLVWQTIGSITVDLPETAYVGFAVEAGKAANELENYATAKFSDIKINKAFGRITYDLENVDYSGADRFALGEDIVITLSNIKKYLLPETVEVTVDGRKVEDVYDREKGTITLENLTGDVVVKARGVKRPVVPVTFEEVDANDLLTVEEKDGKLILTQTAESGATSSGSPAITDSGNSQFPKSSVNESWILFPEVDQLHQMSMKLTVTRLLEVGNDNTGVFVGVFDTDTEAFSTLGFRPCKKTAEAISKFWTKKDKTGNGGTKKPITMDEEYTVNFTFDKNGQYYVEWESETGGSWKETFKANENFLQKGDPVRYGIGLIGATVEITELKLIDHEDNVIYYQDSADYSAVTAAIEKASSLKADDYENFDAVKEAWDAVVLGLPRERQAEVDAMAKALEDAIAALERKQASETAEAEVSESIPQSVLTDAVKEKTGCADIEDLKTFMRNTVVKDAFANADSKVVDVTVKVSFDSGVTWETATETNFPRGGVDIILPYPQGTNKTDYDFTVSHLITMACNGQVPGTLEYPVVEKLDEGLKLHIMSASPFAVAWKRAESQSGGEQPGGEQPGENQPGGNQPGGEQPGGEQPGGEQPGENQPGGNNPVESPADDDDDDDDAVEETGENVSAQAPKTGDDMDVVAVIWSMVLLAAAAGAGTLVYFRRRRTAGGTDIAKSE